MPEYNSVEYWDKRYGEVFPEPFDWLFAYRDVKGLLKEYIRPHHRILIVGCGNAPFSLDIYDDGYHNLYNIDTSSVVIEQMKERSRNRKGIHWDVMDVTKMKFPDHHFDSIIDKSLVDTLMCCEGSEHLLHFMYKDIYRVLKPGGTLFTLSLHQEHDVIKYIDHPELDWLFSSLRLPNPRYDPIENPDRSRDHSMVVCVKMGKNYDDNKRGIEQIAAAMRQKVKLEIHYDHGDKLASVSIEKLQVMLDNALLVYQKMKQHKGAANQIPRIVKAKRQQNSDDEEEEDEEEEAEEGVNMHGEEEEEREAMSDEEEAAVVEREEDREEYEGETSDPAESDESPHSQAGFERSQRGKSQSPKKAFAAAGSQSSSPRSIIPLHAIPEVD